MFQPGDIIRNSFGTYEVIRTERSRGINWLVIQKLNRDSRDGYLPHKTPDYTVRGEVVGRRDPKTRRIVWER